jgi:hypothetical protein
MLTHIDLQRPIGPASEKKQRLLIRRRAEVVGAQQSASLEGAVSQFEGWHGRSARVRGRVRADRPHPHFTFQLRTLSLEGQGGWGAGLPASFDLLARSPFGDDEEEVFDIDLAIAAGGGWERGRRGAQGVALRFAVARMASIISTVSRRSGLRRSACSSA